MAKYTSVRFVLLAALSGCVTQSTPVMNQASWIAGDHHIHSRYSVGWNREVDPPTPIIGGDAIYPIPMNALMARSFGLSWMVATDHGGPNHSKITRDRAYPELVQSRQLVPGVIQFYGMELNTPGADHSSIIIPPGADETDRLFAIESGFDKYDVHPVDAERDVESRMVAALKIMDGMSPKPLVIANHPSRSAPGAHQYGLYAPAELRAWNDTAAEVAVGMAGAPGHQAIALSADGTPRALARGGYRLFPTMGGFDQMTARVGGFWDSMLGEGRRWFITANSDSHKHYTEGGIDFWPGEYSKTYVHAQLNHESIVDAIRSGKVFVTTGDLISELDVTVRNAADIAAASGSLQLTIPGAYDVTISLVDPEGKNHHGDSPRVRRVDVIMGEIGGKTTDPTLDTNNTTKVVKRFYSDDWQGRGTRKTMTHTIIAGKADFYVRVRGTNTDELEPAMDPPGEDPWQDLWFYSNPVFVRR